MAEISPPGVTRLKGVVAASTSAQMALPWRMARVKRSCDLHAIHLG